MYMSRMSLEDGCVCVRIHELFNFGGVGHPDLDHPAFSVGIAVDSLGSLLQSSVDLDDLSGYRHKSVSNGLHSLDGSEYFFFGKILALSLNVYENDVSELVLSVVSDTYSSDIALYFDPFVIFCVRPPD